MGRASDRGATQQATVSLTPGTHLDRYDVGALVGVGGQSPTITMPAMTVAGMILGTAAYMSPEQTAGLPADRRSDVWAFGAVLFEMLTGRRAFAGADVAMTRTAVMRHEPDWSALPATVPPTAAAVLRRCLQKDRRQRVGDVRLALDGAFETIAPPTVSPAESQAARARLVWISLAVALFAAAALPIPALRHLAETSMPEIRTDIVTPPTDQPESFALSPDGREIVFVASGDGASRLWLRSLASTTAQPLAGTEGARLPFWSPDGRSVGFFAAGALKRLDIGGGSNRTGSGDLYLKLASGVGVEERLVASDQTKVANSWSPDGRFLRYGSQDPQTGTDLWVVPMVGDRTPPLVGLPVKRLGPLSVYLASSDGTKLIGARILVDDGGQPRWRSDSRAPFYRRAGTRFC